MPQQHLTAHRIAWFVSPHGFGHAARACGVINAIHQMSPTTHIDIFTTAPGWFFENSLSGPYHYHKEWVDVGLVQRNSLHEDMEATIRQLDLFLPFAPDQLDRLASALIDADCELTVCDIAPIGIAASSKAGIPSLLIENFTWDWIYEHYAGHYPEINRHIHYLRNVFESATYHIQTEPLCRAATPDLTVPPISRFPKTPPYLVRQNLHIPPEAKMALISMGGVPEQFGFIQKLNQIKDYWFVISGNHTYDIRDTVILIPQNSHFYHPDLVQASDIIIGKAGYSTIAEAYAAGVPFAYIPRPNYRESEKLVEFIEKNMNGTPISEAEFRSGDWIDRLPDRIPIRRNNSGANGAYDAAVFGMNVKKTVDYI